MLAHGGLSRRSYAGTPTDGVPADPTAWTTAEVQQWFETHNDGQWSEFMDKFKMLTGAQLAAMTKDDFVAEVPGFAGRAIYNDVQALLDTPVNNGASPQGLPRVTAGAPVWVVSTPVRSRAPA